MMGAMNGRHGALLLVIGWLVLAGVATAGRVMTSLDADWRFALGDHPAANVAGFDDSAWRWVDVPHDWAFEAEFDPDGAQTDKGGYKPGGIGCYRKSFDVPAGLAGKRVWVEFDGVYMDSTVWINGVKSIHLYKELIKEREYIISKQFLRSATSVGANVFEASAASSRKDFVHKMSIASKEARETYYWLILLNEGQVVNVSVDVQIRDIRNIINVLTAIVKTTKDSLETKNNLKLKT